MAFGTAWILSSGSLMLFAQNKIRQLQPKHQVTIGFQAGKSSIFQFPSAIQHKRGKYTNTNTFSMRTAVSRHFKTEAALTCCFPLQNQIFINRKQWSPVLSRNQSFAVPITLQYYPLPRHCRLQPYCGLGTQYTSNAFSGNINASAEENTQATQSGTKYISIIFAQGVTYEINTKIQLTQSFHFIPEADNKCINVGFGVGYTFP